MKYFLFEQAYLEYVQYLNLKLKKQSLKKIKSRIENHILPFFSKCNIFDITERDFLKWQIYIEKQNFSYSYKKTLHYAFVTFLNYCVLFYELDKNVASRVGNFKNKDSVSNEINFFTIDEFNKFILYIDNEIYKQFFNFIFFTGARIGEAMALKFSDLNDGYISINKTISKECENGVRIVNSPKTHSSNRIIEIDFKLNLDLLALLEVYQEKYNDFSYDYYIFGGIKPLSPTTITRIKNLACEKAKIKKIRLHDFRHSHATLLVKNNLMINEISRRLGHSNVSITLNTYVHTDLEQEKKVISTLNSLRF